MGIRIGAIAFKSEAGFQNIENLLTTLFEKNVEKIDLSEGEHFDTRESCNVSVLIHENTTLICNANLVFSIFKSAKTGAPLKLESYSLPSFVFAFVCFDSGGSYGFGLIEDNKLVRARAQMGGNFPPEIDFGNLSNIELNWLQGKVYYHDEDEDHEEKIFINKESRKECAEYFLTQNICEDLFKSYFEFDVFNDEINYKSMYFKLK